MSLKKYSEFLKKGYVLTSKLCPKCKSPLLKDPRTNALFCPICGWKSIEFTEQEVLSDVYTRILTKLSIEEDPKKLYYLLKSLKEIKKLLKK